MVHRFTNAGILTTFVAGLTLLLTGLFPVKSQAQTSVVFDTEYWFAAPYTTSAYWTGTSFRISAFDGPAEVTISMPLNGGFAPKTVNIPAGSTETIPLTDTEISQLINTTGDGIMPTGLLIETDAKISVYYEPGGGGQSPDLISLKGSEALGTEFLVPLQQESNLRVDGTGQQGFVVLATENNTQVTITPKADITGRVAGVPFTITLNRGETYFGQTPGTDPGVSGALVNSDKPVTVTIFAELMRYGASSADLGSEQLVPVSRLGTEYLIVRGYRTSTDIVYFTALEDNTTILVNGVPSAVLNATETYELQTSGTDVFYIETSEVVSALQLSGVAGEQSFSLLPPLSDCSGSNIVSVMRANDGAFYLNIVSADNTGFLVNGDPTILAASEFTEFPGSGWYYARVSVPADLVGAGNPVIVENANPGVKFQLGVFHTNSGGARYGYFSNYAGISINFNQAAAEFCEGAMGIFTTSILSTDPIVSYSWTGPNGFTSSEPNLTIDHLTPGHSGVYTLEVATATCTEQASITLTVNPAPAPPLSGGDQYVCAMDPLQTLTATATVPGSEQITWYDAAAGGNVIADPILNSVGTVTYYAEATSADGCASLTRTPVTLLIQASPNIDPLDDQVLCGPYILPPITGTNLSGNEAYFTETGGAGTRYEAGDEITATGATQLYLYDETESLANCAGSLVVTPNTSMTEADVHQAVVTAGSNHFLYDGTINPDFWEGTGVQEITNRPGLPSMVYMATVGDIGLGSPADCFGSQVTVNISVDVTNNSPNDAWGYSGRVSLIDKTVMEELQATHINSGFPAGATQTISITANLSRADLEAGNLALLIAVETDQTNLEKDWTLSNFQGAFEFIPATTLSCSDEETFSIAIGEIPDAPVSGGNQYVCAADPVQTLTATATAAAGSTVVWYDAPAGGNVVADPSLNAVGSVTYYAEATNGTCESTTRTPVSLVIEAGPDIDPLDDQLACGAYELPLITGTGLSGNEAYYTGPGGTGDRYEPGDLITAVGTNQLYIYDEATAVANCAGTLDASPNTTLLPDNPVFVQTHLPYTGVVDPGFWEGTATQLIQHGAPQTSQVYHSIVGDLSLGSTADCFGTDVEVEASVTITNAGPDNSAGYPGRLAIVNKATGEHLYFTPIPTGFAANSTTNLSVSGIVPLADLSAGNIAVLIAVETSQNLLVKNWELSDFEAGYSFIPASTIGCSDEETFTVTIGDVLPAPLSGGDQEEAEAGQTLTATATLPPGVPAGAVIVWYDAPTGGNVVADPSLSTNGSVTYYAEIQSAGCQGPRTPVKLTLTPLVPEICGNGIDDDGNGVADCDDPACNPYANYFANGSMENYTQCPDMTGSGTMQYVTSWKTSRPADGGQLLVNNPFSGCVAPRPIAAWNTSTNLPAGSDGVAWAGMHGGAAGQPFEDFQNTLVAPLNPGTYTFTFSAGYLNAAPLQFQHPGYFRFYGIAPGDPDFSQANPLGTSPMITNLMTASNPEWKEYSFSFTSTDVYDRILIVAHSGSDGVSYMVFDDFRMSYQAPEIGFQNFLANCADDAVLEVTNPDPLWTSYQWYLDGTPIAGANGPVYIPGGQPGTYSVAGITAENCLTVSSPGVQVESDCPVPFECNGSAYLVSRPSAADLSILSIVDANDPTTVFATITPSIPGGYNGIGYNFEDNLIYGYAAGISSSDINGEILQIDANGNVRRLGRPTSTQPDRAMDVWTNDATVNANGGRVNLAPGVVGLDNKFYALVQTNLPNATHLATVDMTTMTFTTVQLANNLTPADLAFSPYDGMLYGMAGINQILRIDPNTGAQTLVTPTSGTVPSVGAGGAWNDVSGNVYFYTNGGTVANGGHRLYRYNPESGEFVNLTAVDPYPQFDATACFPTRLDKSVVMPANGINPGDEVEVRFSIYNNQMVPMTYDFEDILTSSDLSWVADGVLPANPGGGVVTVSGQTLSIAGITVPPSAANGPLTFSVTLKVADNAAYESCFTNQATLTTGGTTIYSDDPTTADAIDPTEFCLNPCTVLLTIGEVTCDPDNGTYSVSFISNGDVTSTAGTVDVANRMITGIPFGTNITVTAGCNGSVVTSSVTGPTTCPTDCVMPDLTLGQPLCGAGGTYIVSYKEFTGAAITVTGGTDNGNGTITGTIGSPVTVTASNGDCATTLTVASPTDCGVACKNPAISIGGTRCAPDGSRNYEVVFAALPDAVVIASAGTVNMTEGIITGIPAGTDVTVTVQYQTCPDQVITVPAGSCTSDFTAAKSVADASGDGIAQAGEELTYTISVSNTGNVNLTGLTVTDPIPAGTSYQDGSADNGGVYDSAAEALNWTVDIPFGTTLNITFTVIVDDNLTGVTNIANKATVTDPDDPDNPEEPESPPVPVDPERDFASMKSVADANSDGMAQAGEELIYTIAIENTGNVDLTGFTITDPIPATTTYVDGSADNGGVYDAASGQLNWTVDIPYGTTVDITFRVTVDDNLTGVTNIANKATVTDPDDPDNPEEPESPPVPVDPTRDFVSSKSVVDASGDGQAQAGEELTYTITIENTGNIDLTGFTITDPIPAATTYVDGSADNGGVYDATTGQLNWTVDIPYGTTLDINFQVTVDDNLTGIASIANKATVTDPDDPDNPEEPETPPVPVAPTRDFASTKTVTDASGDGQAQAGEVLTYTISIENTGNIDLTGFTITDPIPSSTTYLDGSADNGGVYDAAISQLNWTVDIPYGTTLDITFQVTVDDNLTGVTSIANKATVTDPDDPDNPEEPETPPVPVDPTRDFVSSKSVVDASGDGQAQAGEELTYTISIENTGSVDLTGITITDPIPAATTYVDGSADNGGVYDAASGQLNWSVDIPYGATLDITFQVTVDDNLTGVTSIANKATVTDPDDPDNPEEPETPPVPVDPVSDFTASKSVADASGDGRAEAGEVLTYTISIENTGNVDLTGITITDPIPAATKYVDGSADNGGVYDATTGQVNWAVGIPYGTTLDVTFQVTVDDNLTGITSIANKATVTDPDDPDNPEEPETPPVPVNPVRDFTASKSVSDASGNGNAEAGEALTYTISIENTGNVDLTGITITDPIPASTTYLDGSADNGGVYDATTGQVNWTVDVPYGTTLDVTFQVTVDDNLTGVTSIANKATVTDPDDPDNPEEPETPPVPVAPTRDFASTKTVTDASGDDQAQAGEVLTYTISIENTGNVDLAGITIIDPIPGSTTYLDGSADNGGVYDAAISQLNWTVDIPYGTTLDVTFQVTVDNNLTGVTAIANKATVTDPDDPDNPREPETPPVPVDAKRSYETSKQVTDSGDDGNARAGEELTYTITVENTGNLDLTGFVITDPIPEHTVYVENSADKGGTFENNSLSWTVDIPVGGSESVSFTVEVAGNLTGIDQIANTATVRDPENPDDPKQPKSPDVPVFIPDPIANNDQGEVETGDDVTVPIMDNDETEGSPLDPASIEIIDEPLNGTITINPDGTITYTPDLDFAGRDNFTYRVRDEAGNWSNVAVVEIIVNARPLSIPNLFTPNGDGRNDTFTIPGLEGFPDNELFIVNRWGNEVFRQVNYKNTWTGEGLNEGTYYYVLRIRNAAGEEQVYKGYITLVRAFAK